MRISYAQGELERDWAVFAKIANFFVYKVLPDDREDFHHDLLVEMDKVKAKYEVMGKPLTEASLMMVARYELKDYWSKRRFRLSGLDCSHCIREQRQECLTSKMPYECPKKKVYRILSLNKIIGNGDGNGHQPTELWELIADDKAIDPDAKLDARRILQWLPKRLVKIGYKRYSGIPLEKAEKEYLRHWRKVHPAPFFRGQDHLGERTLDLLCKNPQGLTRSAVASSLRVYVRELTLDINRLIIGQQVIEVRRESIRGRRPSSRLLIAGAKIPEGYNTRGRGFVTSKAAFRRRGKRLKTERDERIRQAYFTDGWSIKRINRELHHDKRTIRRALNPNEVIPWLSR